MDDLARCGIVPSCWCGVAVLETGADLGPFSNETRLGGEPFWTATLSRVGPAEILIEKAGNSSFSVRLSSASPGVTLTLRSTSACFSSAVSFPVFKKLLLSITASEVGILMGTQLENRDSALSLGVGGGPGGAV